MEILPPSWDQHRPYIRAIRKIPVVGALYNILHAFWGAITVIRPEDLEERFQPLIDAGLIQQSEMPNWAQISVEAARMAAFVFFPYEDDQTVKYAGAKFGQPGKRTWILVGEIGLGEHLKQLSGLRSKKWTSLLHLAYVHHTQKRGPNGEPSMGAMTYDFQVLKTIRAQVTLHQLRKRTGQGRATWNDLRTAGLLTPNGIVTKKFKELADPKALGACLRHTYQPQALQRLYQLLHVVYRRDGLYDLKNFLKQVRAAKPMEASPWAQWIGDYYAMCFDRRGGHAAVAQRAKTKGPAIMPRYDEYLDYVIAMTEKALHNEWPGDDEIPENVKWAYFSLDRFLKQAATQTLTPIQVRLLRTPLLRNVYIFEKINAGIDELCHEKDLSRRQYFQYLFQGSRDIQYQMFPDLICMAFGTFRVGTRFLQWAYSLKINAGK